MGPYPHPLGNFSRRAKDRRHQPDPNRRWRQTQTRTSLPPPLLFHRTSAKRTPQQHPLDLLMRMSPLAFIQCVIYGWYTGELERVRAYGATQMTSTKAVALLVNGVIACGLNIVSFTANKKAGALTMTVSAKYVSRFGKIQKGARADGIDFLDEHCSCKQVLTIALAVVLFNLHITPTNGIGILLTLIGGVSLDFLSCFFMLCFNLLNKLITTE